MIGPAWRRALAAVFLFCVSAAAGRADHDAGGGSARAAVDRIRAVPETGRYRYRLDAAIRILPIPGLWIPRRGVGHAELTYRGTGRVHAYELLAGSDPALAPRAINRWAYVAETRDADHSQLIGLIKQSDEQSLGEVDAALARERAEHRFPFKLYAADIEAGQAATGDLVAFATRDFALQDLEPLLQQIGATAVPMARRQAVNGQTRVGLLHAVLEALQALVAESRQGRPAPDRPVPYFFNGVGYEVQVTSTAVLPVLQVGDRTYRDVLSVDFEGRQPGTSKRVPFEIACQREGPLQAVPLMVTVRPRWWFQFQLLLNQGTVPPGVGGPTRVRPPS